jgi:hypothetical protein
MMKVSSASTRVSFFFFFFFFFLLRCGVSSGVS